MNTEQSLLLVILCMCLTILIGLSLAIFYFGGSSRPRTIKFLLMNNKATIPIRGTEKSAGYDLTAAEECVVLPGERKMIKTGLKCVLPKNTYGRVASRSSLSLKHGIEIGAGVIDEDYENEIMVILYNHGDEEFKVTENHRIAQLIIENVVYPTTMIEINGVTSPANTYVRTARGLGGFGSTGF